MTKQRDVVEEAKESVAEFRALHGSCAPHDCTGGVDAELVERLIAECERLREEVDGFIRETVACKMERMKEESNEDTNL